MTANRIGIGQLIKNQRIASSLTIQELAKASGVSASHLGRIERGERSPSGKTLKKIAKPLGFDENEMFTLAGYLSSPTTGVSEKPPTYSGSRLLDPWVARTLAQETPEVQRLVISILMLLRNVARAVVQERNSPKATQTGK